MKQSIFSLMLLFLCSSVFAQTDNDMKAWQDYMTPGAVHKMLAKYDGEWNEEVSMWMAPGAPPQVSQAVTKNEMVMGGRYQVSKTSGNMMGMPFEGMSTLGYDNIKKIFTSTWIDNFGTGTMALTGTWDEKTKTITLKGKALDPMSGKDQDVKQTMQFIDDDHQLIEMFNITPQGEFKSMSIKIARKK
jgi:hypothetical protein